MAGVLVQGALLVLGPFIVLMVFGRGRALRWDVVVVGAIAFVISEPFRILTAPIFGAAAVWQALGIYIPLRAFGVRDRDEPLTLGLAFGGAQVVSSGIALVVALSTGGAATLSVPALIAAAADIALAPALALFAAHAVRTRQARWVLAMIGLGVLATLGLPELVAVAIAAWWLSSLLPAQVASDSTP